MLGNYAREWMLKCQTFVTCRLIRVRELTDALPYWNRLLTYIARVLPDLKDFTVVFSLTLGLMAFTHLVACVLYYFGHPKWDQPGCEFEQPPVLD